MIQETKKIDPDALHCLYIEPDQKTVELVEKNVKEWVSSVKLRIFHAQNLDTAIEALQQKNYDLILTDIYFPESDLDPVQIIQEIQNHSNGISIAAIYEMPDTKIPEQLFPIGVLECINLASAVMQPKIAKHRFIHLINEIQKEKTTTNQMKQVSGLISSILENDSQDEFDNLNDSLHNVAIQLEKIRDRQIEDKHKYKQLKDAFGMYVDPKIIDNVILGKGEQLKNGVHQDITILFSDLRGYTRMSSGMSSQNIVSFLNEFYTAMTEVVMGYNGLIDKYIGDGIMCIFGAPMEDENHVVNAVEAAIEMQSVFELWQKTWQKSYGIKPAQGIGLACGQTVVGNLGSFQKISYTAIGSSVNLAARLESVAEAGDIVISAQMHERLEKSGKNNYNFEALSPIPIRGMDGRHHIYRLTKEIDLDDILVETE